MLADQRNDIALDSTVLHGRNQTQADDFLLMFRLLQQHLALLCGLQGIQHGAAQRISIHFLFRQEIMAAVSHGLNRGFARAIAGDHYFPGLTVKIVLQHMIQGIQPVADRQSVVDHDQIVIFPSYSRVHGGDAVHLVHLNGEIGFVRHPSNARAVELAIIQKQDTNVTGHRHRKGS